ncbi:TMV resistance protein N-like [Pyrus ussuriensis x Pyrus communis]|uniref:TMV resistance protein N-like n=1 Tax=Pyrus ussuriensis x Pyrus communis TaxID=2448454 RepID=A0A5N5HMU8_9ROSA|nr:TMV resistance protein N-like [Pyrus ussuriensis x Pyrus communis]
MEILNRLKISFDELADDDLKAIFLDMSCFFAGMNKDYVMKILDGCDLYPEIGISVLQERCLVTTIDDFTLVMHDLLRDMGRYIVHAESPDDPGKRSRLWRRDDVIDVLKNESVSTSAIKFYVKIMYLISMHIAHIINCISWMIQQYTTQ